MTDALAELLRAFRAAGLEPTADHVVEAAWLARWMAPRPPARPPVAPPRPAADPPAPAPPPAAEADASEPPAPDPTPPAEPPAPDPTPPADEGPEPLFGGEAGAGDELGVYVPATGGGGGGEGGRPFQAPAAPAVPRPLELARALRPLRRRSPSRSRFVLDAAETIRRFADERLADPVLRPARERWLRLALVTDTGPGADLWADAAREFRALLANFGGFRDVRGWSLDSGCKPPRLTPGARPDGPARHPNELIDPTGRTLAVVVSPCVGPAWYDGGVAAVLGAWARHGPVLLVPLLPEFLWPRTALAGASAAMFQTPAAGASNARLVPVLADAWPGDEPPAGVNVPAAVLEPASLGRWARLAAGRPGATAPGFVLDPSAAPPAAPAADGQPAAERVERFRRAASPPARELAGLLAASPVVSLPVVRLVRQALLPGAGQPHEAEVLFGGLLVRQPGEGDPRFDFVPGVRELLLGAVPTDHSLSVLAAVSDYVGEHLADGRKFSAVLANPASAAGELAADAGPFAKVAADVLTRAGGAYARIVSPKRPALRPARTQQELAEMLVGTTWRKRNGFEEIHFRSRTSFRHIFNPDDPGERSETENAYRIEDEPGVMTLLWSADGFRARCVFHDAFTTFVENDDPRYTWAVVHETGRDDPGRTALDTRRLEPVAPSGPPVPVPAEAEPEVEASLEAFTRVERTGAEHLWRYALPRGESVRLGSSAGHSDWAVPEDVMLSRFHATLEWDGRVLTVARRGPTPEFPAPPANAIWFRNELVERCVVRPGEWFVIGQTRFTVRTGLPAEVPPARREVAAVASERTVGHAELEAITDIPFDPRRSSVLARRYGRRFPLTAGKALHLGRDEAKMDMAIPEDDQLSRFQAILNWEPESGRLTVRTRPSMPPLYATPPANQTLVFDDKEKKLVEVPGGECVVGKGVPFWIGQTRFTVLGGGEAEPESPADQTVAPRREERTRAQLEEIPFANPVMALRALEQLPAVMRAASSEQGLLRQMLRLVMEAMPRADAAAIVRIPPGEHRLAVVESNVRPKVANGPKDDFLPSRRLAHRAIAETRRSCLHCWAPDATDAVSLDVALTLAAPTVHGVTPWAICTPFQDGSNCALYVAGQTGGQWNLLDKAQQDKIVGDLTQYQKIAELLVGVFETTLRVSRLTQQNKVTRRAWPENLRKYLDDPARMEQMLAPREMEVTTLFCDLRDYSQLVAQSTSALLAAQREVAAALNVMSSAITDRDGVVSGFRGDAVLGFWGWPQPHDNQITLAARAALAVQARLGTRSGVGGVALAHGTAVVGRLGPHELAAVDVFGPVVDLTYRLEALARAFGVPILVSRAIADGVAAADPYGREMRTRPLGSVCRKGFPEMLSVHELYSAANPSIQDWQTDAWAEALDLFTQGQWADAYDLLSAQFPDDPAARCLMRVMDQTGRRPGAEWKGAFEVPASAE